MNDGGGSTFALIPVLDTGIEPREVLRLKMFPGAMDMVLLDPCDERRNDKLAGSL